MSYVLDNDDRVTIARRPMTITITGRDGAGAPLGEGAVELAVEHARHDGRTAAAAAPHALFPRPGLLVLPRLEGAVVVRVRPGQGRRTFPEGTILNLVLHTERARDGLSDGDTVVVRDVEVSGLVERDLLRIGEHDAGRVAVAALAVVPDEPLGALATAARAAARHRLGVERVAEARSLRVTVDMSASMAPRLADGSVAAVVDVVVGLSHVLGAGRAVGVSLLADPVRTVPAVPPAQLAATTTREAAAAGLGCGFRSTPPGAGADRETVVYVVTDAVPPDVEALRAARRRGEHVGLVVVGGGLPSRAARDVPTARLAPPPAGVTADAHLRGSSALLGDLVAALLSAAGTVAP